MPARNVAAARYFASLYDIVSRRWPLASFGLLGRWKESQRRSPVRESRQLSQKGESPPWQIPDARIAAVRLPSSERDRENTLWPESALGRRVLGVSCVLEIEVRTHGRRLQRTQEIVSVPSYVDGGRSALDRGPNKLNAVEQLSNRTVSLPQHRFGRTCRFQRDYLRDRACAMKNYVPV